MEELRCKQCSLLLREIEAWKTENNRNNVLFKVSESRYRDKAKTVKEMQEFINQQDLKINAQSNRIKEQAEELQKLEQQILELNN